MTKHSLTWIRPVPPIISSVRVEFEPSHDVIHIWNRGEKAGHIVVAKGDWREIITRLGFDPDDYDAGVFDPGDRPERKPEDF